MTTVINGRGSRRLRKKAAVRSRILAEALRLFTERGIEEVTVDEIADAADVGKGTIYNYFHTKEDIVVAFMIDLERDVQAELQDFTSRQRGARAILIDFVRTQFQRKERYHPFVRVFLGHMFLHTDQFVPYMAEMQKAIDPPLEHLFTSLQRRGAIRSDVSMADLIPVFKTMHLGLTALWAIEGPPFRGVQRVIDREITLLCRGLEAAKS